MATEIHTKRKKSSNNITLPNEYFEGIFKYLFNDKGTLYSCLLVSRTFSYSAVKILWSQPFTLLNEAPSSQLVQTLIDCLDDENKKDLITKCRLSLDICSKKYRQPLFDYLSFVRELNYLYFFESTNSWLQKILSDRRRYQANSHIINHDANAITFYLITAIMLRGRQIRSLIWFNNDNLSCRTPLIRFPREVLSKVQHIYCGGIHISNSALLQLTTICNNIIDIEISHYNKPDSSHFAALIKSQKNLRHVSFNSISGGTWRLIEALHSQASTLRSLKFVNTNFAGVYSKGLAVCSNLKSLEFFDCQGISVEKFWRPIVESSNFHLKKLSLTRTGVIPKVIEKFITTSKLELEELSVDRTVTTEVPRLMEMVANNCPNISYLRIYLNNVEEISLLFFCVAISSKLKTLIARTSDGMDISNVLPTFSDLIPLSLRVLDLDMIISAESLRSFLKDCEAPIQRIIMNRNFVREEHIRVLVNHALEKGNLKSIGYSYARKGGQTESGNLKIIEERAKEYVAFVDPADQNDYFFQYPGPCGNRNMFFI